MQRNTPILIGMLVALVACSKADPSANEKVKSAVWNVTCDGAKNHVADIITELRPESDSDLVRLEGNVTKPELKFGYELARETFKHRETWTNIPEPITRSYSNPNLSPDRDLSARKDAIRSIAKAICLSMLH